MPAVSAVRTTPRTLQPLALAQDTSVARSLPKRQTTRAPRVSSAHAELAGIGTYCDKDGTLWVTQLFGCHVDSPTVDTSVTPPQDPIARASTETGSTCGGACGDG